MVTGMTKLRPVPDPVSEEADHDPLAGGPGAAASRAAGVPADRPAVPVEAARPEPGVDRPRRVRRPDPRAGPDRPLDPVAAVGDRGLDRRRLPRPRGGVTSTVTVIRTIRLRSTE